MEPKDRIKIAASAMASAVKQKASPSRQKAVGPPLSREEFDSLIEDWPETPKKVAMEMIEKYGPPDEGTSNVLIWYNNGPWQRSLLYRHEIAHNFPMPHTDFLMQFIRYRVPVERIDDLAAFDGSVIVDRTAGEIAARCDTEAMNTLTLNLVHEILNNRLTVESARDKFAETAAAYMLNRPAPLTEKLQFDPSGPDAADLDETHMAGAMASEAAQKIKDLLS